MKKIEATNNFEFISHTTDYPHISQLKIRIKDQELELETAMNTVDLFVQNLTVNTRLDNENKQSEYMLGTFTQHHNNDLIFLTHKEVADLETQIIISPETEKDDQYLEHINKKSTEEKICEKNLQDYQKSRDENIKYNSLMHFIEAYDADGDPNPDVPNQITIQIYLNQEMYNSLKELIINKSLSKLLLNLRSNNIFQAGSFVPTWGLQKMEAFYFYFTNAKEEKTLQHIVAYSEVEFASTKLENKTESEIEEENLAKKEKRKARMVQWKKTSKVRFYTIAVLLIIIIFLLLSNS